MKYVSIFSGIEAATVAWHPLGWEPLAFSEIDPFPSTVLQHHYPDIPNLGDITKIDWSPYVGAADIVVGGSPCQSFSVAGKREGLAGASGLMFEYIRAVRELRPRWFVWENVPGAFTSERGEAYRQLLSEMDALGYGLAWRVLDAQFFGVAQRRERVFLVPIWDIGVIVGEGALIQRDMSATLSTHNIQTPITGGREKRGLTVRRLTPRECERLQGFPDDYTDIPYRNKEHAPDGPRYKALGNSMAVPVMRWIGERIRTVEEAAETTG